MAWVVDVVACVVGVISLLGVTSIEVVGVITGFLMVEAVCWESKKWK